MCRSNILFHLKHFLKILTLRKIKLSYKSSPKGSRYRRRYITSIGPKVDILFQQIPENRKHNHTATHSYGLFKKNIKNFKVNSVKKKNSSLCVIYINAMFIYIHNTLRII